MNDTAEHPFSMAVQWVNRPNLDFRGFAGRIASGTVRQGDRIRVSPSGIESQVKQIMSGDGAIEEGVFYESVNFAAVRKIPAIFLCENNNFSVYSHISERQPQNRRIFTMAEGLGITSKYLDSSNPDKSLIELSDVIETTRSTHSPAFIEIDTFRFLEHCGPASDDHLDYRDSNYIDDAKSKDPLALLEHELTREIQDWGSFFLGLRKAIDVEIGQAFDFARNSPYPDPSLENPSAYAEARL